MVKPLRTDVFSFFGPDYDRFDFHGPITRVTAGHGGEVILIEGSERNAIIDCGMAYCGRRTAENIRHSLGDKSLDYIILTHSHYDHLGGLPYIKDLYPNAQVLASEKCQKVLWSDNAKAFIKKMGEEAKATYEPESEDEIRIDSLQVDEVLREEDVISLGDEKIKAFETKGHTDCSMSYLLNPAGILFTSESTGILEGKNYVTAPILKSFDDAYKSAELCQSLKPKHICVPHFGLIPEEYNNRYFQLFKETCDKVILFVWDLMKEGASFEEMYKAYCEEYWNPELEQEQPFEAFAVNAKHIIMAVMNLIKGDINV